MCGVVIIAVGDLFGNDWETISKSSGLLSSVPRGWGQPLISLVSSLRLDLGRPQNDLYSQAMLLSGLGVVLHQHLTRSTSYRIEDVLAEVGS